MMKQFILFFFIPILFIVEGYSQTFDQEKLDLYLNTLAANNKFMGSVAVAKEGKIIYTKAVGYADVEQDLKADIHTKYRIGSISKTFTAVLILKAVENKKLALDKTIETYFPTIQNASKITIKQLLGHRSGIHNFTDDEAFMTYHTLAKSEAEMIAILAKAGSDFEPDTKAAYSNSNYVLLSYILEKTYKKPYAKILEQQITQPLKLKNTYLGKKINTSNKECKSYAFVGKWEEMPESDMSIPIGAGGIVSTPSDLVTFSDALFQHKLVQPESLKLMTTFKDNYAIGLFEMPFYDKMGYGHTGGIDGFGSSFAHFYDDNLSYAITTNGANYNTNDISITVLKAVYGKAYDMPNFTTVTLKSEDLDPYLGTYATEAFPLKITITKEDNILIAQATGQSSFPLEAKGNHTFSFDEAGIELKFNPEKKALILFQGGGEVEFAME